MDDTSGNHWSDVSEYGDDKNKIHSLRWDVQVKEKENFINREFLVSIPNLKGGNIVCTCVNDQIVE